MKNLSIYFSDDDEYAEYACKSNGMRPDVLVAIDGKLFHPMIYDIFTLFLIIMVLFNYPLYFYSFVIYTIFFRTLFVI